MLSLLSLLVGIESQHKTRIGMKTVSEGVCSFTTGGKDNMQAWDKQVIQQGAGREGRQPSTAVNAWAWADQVASPSHTFTISKGAVKPRLQGDLRGLK